MSSITIVLFLVGLGLLIGGAELLIRGAARLATALGVSPLVVGLTVVAFGTNAPELAVAVQSTLAGQPDLALGSIVGSNIANILLILGITALVSPLVVAPQILRRDIPVMIGVSVLLLLLAFDGRLSRVDGALLVVGLLLYNGWTVWASRRASAATRAAFAAEYGAPPRQTVQTLLLQLGLVVAGLALLTLGARWLVAGAVAFATYLGLSELVIGLTVVAVGTSLPEIAASIVAGLRGQRDIAIGNVVGSCIFNILSVLGIASALSPNGMDVASTAIAFDLPVMVVVAVACLPIAFHGYAILRWEGAVLLVYYAAYTGYLVLRATNSAALPLVGTALWFYVLPLTIVTELVIIIRDLHRARRTHGVSSA